MSTLGTFLLAVAAFLGTVMFLINPLTKMEKQLRGRRRSEISEELKTAWETDPSNMVIKGCGYCSFVLLALGYTFVVEPLAVVSALINKIGYQPVAYFMLFIVAISWFRFAHSLINNKKKSPPTSGTIITSGGETVTGEVVNLDEEVKFGNPTWNTIRRLFFFLPDLYLWYMFLVVIGITK